MVNPDDIGRAFDQNWWSIFSGFGTWLGMLFIGLLVVAAIFLLFQVLQYRIKVTYFPIQGDPVKGDITLGKPKNDRGRRLKKRGIPYFRLLMGRKTIKDIPYEMEYPDGVFLLRKSNEEFIPIPRPSLGNPSVKIHVIDPALQLWDQLRGQDVVKRFTDEDWKKKEMLIFAGIIVACLIFAGVVIWMSYATSNAALTKTGQVTTALNNLAGKIGLGAPG